MLRMNILKSICAFITILIKLHTIKNWETVQYVHLLTWKKTSHNKELIWHDISCGKKC